MFFTKKIKTINFSKTNWYKNREERFYMIPDLIDNKRIKGLNKEEVRTLLGFEFNDIHSNTWSYYIGSRYNFMFSSQYLFIYFNDFGEVIKLKKK